MYGAFSFSMEAEVELKDSRDLRSSLQSYEKQSEGYRLGLL
jgi:hypothetical protein